MILKSLHLENFRRFKNLDIEFSDGVIGIVGPNGSGKSTILEAVSWCLYGNRAARTGKEGIKRQSASMIAKCGVTLRFALGDTEYCLNRSMTGKSNKTEAKLTQEGKIDAISARGVDDYVIRLLGMDLKGFMSSFFARQKELNALSDARPADRKNHLAKMLGVGRLDEAIELLKYEIKAIRGKIDILESRQIDPKEVESQLLEKRKLLTERQLSESSTGRFIDGLKKEFAQKSAEFEKWQEKERLFNQLEKEIAVILAQKETAGKEIDYYSNELESLDILIKTLPELEVSITGLEKLEKEVDNFKRQKGLNEEKTRLDVELGGLKKKIEKNNCEKIDKLKRLSGFEQNKTEIVSNCQSVDELEVKLGQLREERQKISNDLSSSRTELNKLNTQKSRIDELGADAVCELCLRPFGDEFSEIETHIDQEILSLELRIAPHEKRADELKKESEELNSSLKTAKLLAGKLLTVERKIEITQTELRGIELALKNDQDRFIIIEGRLLEIGKIEFSQDFLDQKEKELQVIRAKREEYLQITERVSRLNKVKENLEKNKTVLADLLSQESKIGIRLEKLGFAPENYQEIQNKIEELREGINRHKLLLERILGGIKLVGAEINTLREKLDKYEESKAEISLLRQTLTYQEKLSLLFGEFRVFLIGRIRPSLGRRTSELFSKMTDGRYQDVELDEDYSLCVFDQGERFSIERFSGGEIDLANLCFRLAISEEMSETAGIDQSFIILDEVFGSQDSDRQKLIINGLNRLKNRFRQIIVVSHIEEVKELSEYVLAVERGDSGGSVVVPGGAA